MYEYGRLFLQKAGLAVLSALHAERWFDGTSLWSGGVLMLHRVRPQPDETFRPNANLEITPDFLDRILGSLRRQGIALVSLEEASERLRSGRPAGRFVAITLDDGYRDNHDHAWPVFRAHDAPFTVFMATGMIDATATAWWMTLEEVVRRNARIRAGFAAGEEHFDATTHWGKRRTYSRLSSRLCCMDMPQLDRFVRRLAADHEFDIPAMLRTEMMNWDEARTMSADPLCSIGGHTVSHPALARLSDDEALREICDGLDRIEAMIGHRPTTFAYPYGDKTAVSGRDVALAAELGFKVAVTTRRGMLQSDHARTQTDWPRLSVNGHFQNLREFDLLLSGVPFYLEQVGWRSMPFIRPSSRAVLPARST